MYVCISTYVYEYAYPCTLSLCLHIPTATPYTCLDPFHNINGRCLSAHDQDAWTFHMPC